MKIEASYSFVHNRLIFFVYCQGESKKEKIHENTVYEFMRGQIELLQSDLDNSFFILEYDLEMISIVEKMIILAFERTQKQFQGLEIKLVQIKRIIGTA